MNRNAGIVVGKMMGWMCVPQGNPMPWLGDGNSTKLTGVEHRRQPVVLLHLRQSLNAGGLVNDETGAGDAG
jgi:hypothetical protein